MKLLVIILFGALIYSLRHIKPFGAIWRGIKAFMLVLLLTLGVNYAKKSIKDWWSK
jgi:chromate transport protein ChrA